MTTVHPSPDSSCTDRVSTDAVPPDCGDWRRLGPTPADAALRIAASEREAAAGRREALWSKGFSRRRLLEGGLGLGVAALGTQLVTTRVAYGAPSAAATSSAKTGALVVVFLRGGMDGLSLLVPAGDANLAAARPDIGVQARSLIAMDRNFGLHPAMAPLAPLLAAGGLAAVPGVTTPDLTRSHFQAQQCLELGGSGTAGSTGWLDRVLEACGPGTTFRSVSAGGVSPLSLAGAQGAISFNSLDQLKVGGAGNEPWPEATYAALQGLYTGLDDPLADQATLGIGAVLVAGKLVAAGGEAQQGRAAYPSGTFASSLRDVATLIRSGLGMRLACLDVGGWDMHSGAGTVDKGDMTSHVGSMAAALAAFCKDLGDSLATTTIVTMSEFGRRVQQNGSGGTDHGHGGVSLVLGGGVKGGVKGPWKGLSPDVLDQGDVPQCTDFRDLLSEVVGARLGVSMGAMGSVFPGWTPHPVGVMA